MRLVRKIFSRGLTKKILLPGGGVLVRRPKQMFDISKPGLGKANKAAKRALSRAEGAESLGITKYTSNGGKTTINPEYNSRRVLWEGRSHARGSYNPYERVLDANANLGKASVHDRINLRGDRGKRVGDHVDLENAFAFESHGYKPIRNLNRGYLGAFDQEIAGYRTSFKDNPALQNLGVVPKPKKWWHFGK